MTRRQGRIGRHNGRKRSSNRKVISYTNKCSNNNPKPIVNDECFSGHTTLLQDIFAYQDTSLTTGWRTTRGIHCRNDKIRKLQVENSILRK